MTDNLYLDNNARAALMRGITKSAQAVGVTMGTGGSNAMIEAIENPGYLNTNDGATILGAIRFADPLEDMGRKILLEAVSRANKASGDGSSTTTVLTAAIIEEGIKYLGNFSPMDIKRSLEAQVPIIEASLKAQSKEVTVDDVANAASISAEDPAIGALIQEIYQKIGKDGVIHWDISKTTEDTYTIGNGITIDGAGFLSPYMCDIDERSGQFLNVARWRNPHVLVIKQKITSAADFNTLFTKLYAKEIKEVVVFCDEIEATVIPDLIQTRAVRGFKTLVVKMPLLWKDQWYEDLALASGATIIDPGAGVSLKTMDETHVGTFGNIVVGKEETFIDGIRDLTEHTKVLAEGTDEDKLRAARLNTRTARLFIGAQSDSALSYKRLKIEDAISAAYQALHGGVVPGAGMALTQTVKDIELDSVGGMILNNALFAPCDRILKNAKIKDSSMLPNGEGYDTRTGRIVNLFEAGIVDPTTVVINAVKNAVSVAASVLTVETVVMLPRQDDKQHNVPV